MQFDIPCELISRLSKALRHLPTDASGWFKSIRIENNMAIVSNKRILIIERLPSKQPDGIIHIDATPALIEQCEREAAFASSLKIVVTPMLKWATAVTTLGYNYPANAVLWDAGEENGFDRWKSIIPAPATEPHGAMMWNTDQIRDIAETSPSGRIVLEEIIDVRQPIIVRDMLDDNWFALFIPTSVKNNYSPAKIPEWFK